jgi:polar amino acid transport system substrate-binding protein
MTMNFRNILQVGIALIFSVAILLTGFSLAAQADSKLIVIGSDPWCPFVCVDEGSNQGLMVDIAIEALALSGYKVTFQNINWARAKKMVRAGKLDGIVGTSQSTQDQTPYDFPETALGVAVTCFFRRVGDAWEYTSVASLEKHTMGWINDYGFGSGSPLDEWVKAHKGTSNILTVSGTNTHPRLFKLLQGKRINTFAEDRFVISYALKKMALLDKIEPAGCVEPTEKVYVAFSQKTGKGKTLAKALDEGVVGLRQSGRLRAILEVYGLTLDDWQPQ